MTVSETDHAPDVDATDARQARWGRHAFAILVTSLVLVVIALFGSWAYFSGALSGQHGNKEAPAAVARTVDTTPSPVRQN